MGNKERESAQPSQEHMFMLNNKMLFDFMSLVNVHFVFNQAPERVNVKKGFFGKLSTILSEARKAHHRVSQIIFTKNSSEICKVPNHIKYT